MMLEFALGFLCGSVIWLAVLSFLHLKSKPVRDETGKTRPEFVIKPFRNRTERPDNARARKYGTPEYRREKIYELNKGAGENEYL